jgi:hypothetical protein
VAEGSDAWLYDSIAVLQALHRHDVRQFSHGRKDHHWGKRELRPG